MYQALGRRVIKNRDGSFTVHVEIVDDRTNTTVRFQDYTARTQDALAVLVRADLDALVASEQDAALSAAFVNVLIAQL